MKQNKKSTTKSKKLKHKKIYKSTVPKGFVSLHTIIILLTSILAITISDGNNITASVVVDVPTDYESTFSIIEVSSISNLNQLNEGWYSIRNGHVFYLDKFDSYIPLYIKATNPPNLNGLLVIDSDGNIEFEENDLELTEQTKVDNRNGETLNQITGEVSGLEKVSGFATITFITLDHANIALGSGSINEGDEIVLLNDGTRYLAVNSGGSLTLSPISASSPPAPSAPAAQSTNRPPLPGQSVSTVEGSTSPPLPELELYNKLRPGQRGIGQDNLGNTWEYYKDSNGALRRFRGRTVEGVWQGNWEDVEFDFYITAGIDGQTISTIYPSTTPANAEAAARAQGLTPIGNTQLATHGSILPTGEWVSKSFGNPPIIFVTNGQGETRSIPEGYASADAYANELNQIVEINNAYTVWKSTQDPNIPEEILKRTFFAGSGLDNIDPELIEITLGLSPLDPTQTGEPTGEKPYLETTSPDGKITTYVYNDEPFIGEEGKARLDAILQFEEDFPGARLQEGFTTASGEDVYLFRGRYITPTNTDGSVIEATRTETIGGTEYAIAYELNNGRIIPKSTTIHGAPVSLTSQSLRALRLNAAEGDDVRVISGDIVITRDSTTPQGDPSSDDFRTSTTVTTINIDSTGAVQSEISNEIRDANYQIISRTLETRSSDGSRKIETYGGNNQLEKISYITPNGQTLALNNELFQTISTQYGTETDRILSAAAQEGFKNPSVNSDGHLVDGSRKLATIRTPSGRTIIFLDGNKVVSGYEENGLEIRYTGDVTLVPGGTGVKFNGDSTVSTYRDDILVEYIRNDNNGNTLFTANYEAGTVRVNGHRTFVLGDRISDPNSPFYRSYRFTSNGDTYYLEGGTVYRQGEDGEKIKVDDSQFKDAEKDALGLSIDEQRKSQGIPTRRQAASQRFFANLEAIFTEFRGLGYISSIFWGDDQLLKWRDDVDRAFATAYLGTEYWSSAICDVKLDGEQVGVAYAETPSGIAQVGAHIEATRTQPIVNTTGHTTYIYKITFSVRNGDFDKDPRAPERMDINAIIKGDARNVILFKRDINILRGDTFGRTGTTAIVNESETLYDQVCLTFNRIPLRWKIDRTERVEGKNEEVYILCNNIQESSGQPTALESQAATATTGTDADLNDF